MNHTDVFDLYQSGRRHLDEGDVRQGVKDLEAAARLDPESTAIQRLLAVAYFRTAALGRAEQAARAVVRQNPADAETTHLLGRCLSRQNRPEDARRWLRLAAAMDPRPEYQEAVRTVSVVDDSPMFQFAIEETSAE